jgi:hypothetical protein
MISVLAATTQADVVTNDLVYLNAHVSTATITGGTSVSVLSALGTACDAALAGSYGSPDDLAAALQPCDDAISWIECRSDAGPSALGTVCPDAADAALWQQRFTQMNAVTVAMNAQTSLYPVSFGIAELAASNAAGLAAGAASLQQALSGDSVPLDLGVANYLAAFAIASYMGVSTASYVTNYASVPGYALDASDTASAAAWLSQNGLLSSAQALSIIEDLYADPTVDVADKLYLEDIEYQAGVLQ